MIENHGATLPPVLADRQDAADRRLIAGKPQRFGDRGVDFDLVLLHDVVAF